MENVTSFETTFSQIDSSGEIKRHSSNKKFYFIFQSINRFEKKNKPFFLLYFIVERKGRIKIYQREINHFSSSFIQVAPETQIGNPEKRSISERILQFDEHVSFKFTFFTLTFLDPLIMKCYGKR